MSWLLSATALVAAMSYFLAALLLVLHSGSCVMRMCQCHHTDTAAVHNDISQWIKRKRQISTCTSTFFTGLHEQQIKQAGSIRFLFLNQIFLLVLCRMMCEQWRAHLSTVCVMMGTGRESLLLLAGSMGMCTGTTVYIAPPCLGECAGEV